MAHGGGATMSKWLLPAAIALSLGAAPALAREDVFDVHVHLHDGASSLAEYRAQNARDGVEAAGFGAMWFGGPNQARAGDIEGARTAHDALARLAAANPRMVPIATVHPHDGEAALAELDRVAALGFKVLKIHPHTQGFDLADPRVGALVERAGARGLVVLVDNAGIVPNDTVHLFNLALAHPGTRFVFAHMGGLDFRAWNILALARTADGLFADNIYFDISATVLLAADSPLEEEFVWTMRNVGIDRLLLGSDFPQFSLGRTLAALDALDLAEEDAAKIRYGNARRLFGLD